MTTHRLPTYFIPHGGGPCFFMDWPGDPHMWDRMANFLRSVSPSLPKRPKAILIVSGHWEEAEFTLGATTQPGLIYDYYGFPEHTYQLEYAAPGAPELAARVQTLLTTAGITVNHEESRGWDHGVFIPLKVMFPDADIPVLQLSMKKGLDAAEHLRVGQTLQTLRDENVLILGSGMSFHNMRGFSPAFRDASAQFDDWLANMATQAENARNMLLQDWQNAPHARQVQPHPDHLLPLMVAAGAAGTDTGVRVFQDTVMNVVVSALAFGTGKNATQ
ncbi:class III extradiol ring-cleavage dioxygenase [uncultured Oxalicibacterium sp.]|uniref:DODA-type extradiol aromatic ring-opening family dioxygenase n=1 Tax=uncultured Oxalicibacterium sp. TaxID=1168540 RepID=UPI0025DF7BF1|nr:class III extradiol ring-cleavage dioxygenase [uncultured Oxalicibacterium sp.]